MGERGTGRNKVRRGLADNCQIISVRSDNCQIGQLSDRTTVRSDNCQWDNCQWAMDNCQKKLSVL